VEVEGGWEEQVMEVSGLTGVDGIMESNRLLGSDAHGDHLETEGWVSTI